MSLAAQRHDVGPSGYEFNRLTLKFADAAVESRFAVDCLTHSIPILQVALIAAAVAYASFGILDHYMVPGIANVTSWIRYAVVCPAFLSGAIFSRTRFFPPVAHLAVPTAMLLAAVGILAMLGLADEPGRSFYYAGLIIVSITGSSLVPTRWIGIALASAAILGGYQLVAVSINPISSHNLLNNDFFLCVVMIAGTGAAYLHELKTRRLFIRDEGLRIAREQSEVLRTRAEAANKAKTEFLALMSHELRTPLNAILGFSEIMNMQVFGSIGSDRYVSYAHDIHESAEHLLAIITDILDLSKAEVGDLSIQESEVDITAIVDYCLRLLRERAAETGVRLSFRDITGRRGVTVRGDDRLIKQVIVNVVGNALKFTPSGGTVEITLRLDADGSCSVCCADTGIGIAEADLHKIVEPFVQIESAFARKHGGIGLGLPLVKKILELHGGGIVIRSTLGAGTEVTARFPPQRVAAHDVPIAGVA